MVITISADVEKLNFMESHGVRSEQQANVFCRRQAADWRGI